LLRLSTPVAFEELWSLTGTRYRQSETSS